jgi:3-methyladenine DNA glycosylase/8-oxoguanine DNA glycosylase
MSAGVGTVRRRKFRPAMAVDIGLSLAPLQRAGRSDPSVRVGGGDAWRATRNAAGLATVHYRTDGDSIEVEAWGAGAELELERAPDVLGGSDNLAGFAPVDPVVAGLHRRFAGLRIIRTSAVFEALVHIVFEQKVIGAEARNGYLRLIKSRGEPAPGPAGLMVPPGATQLAHMPYFEFHQFAVERRRAETIIGAARKADWLEACVDLSPKDALARMTALPGIGAWSAAQAALVALGDADAVPVGDYHMPNMVAWAFTGERQGNDAMMLELLEPFRGHRGRVIRLLMAGGVGPPRRGPRLGFRRMELG